MLALGKTADELQTIRNRLADVPRPSAAEKERLRNRVDTIGHLLADDVRIGGYTQLRCKLIQECHELFERINGRQSRSTKPRIVITLEE